MNILNLDSVTKHFGQQCRLCKNGYTITDDYKNLDYCPMCEMRLEQTEHDLKQGTYATAG